MLNVFITLLNVFKILFVQRFFSYTYGVVYYPLIQHKTLTVYEAKNVLKAFHFILLSARLVVTFSAPDHHRPRAPISTAWTVNRGTCAWMTFRIAAQQVSQPASLWLIQCLHHAEVQVLTLNAWNLTFLTLLLTKWIITWWYSKQSELFCEIQTIKEIFYEL